MAMEDSPTFGPYQAWGSISSFSRISEAAYELFDARLQLDANRISRPIHHLFARMIYQGKTTSLAIRLINSWALNLPAFALLRVRLEQTIVSSYLIHEDESQGLKAFVSFIPIREHKAVKAAMEDPQLRKFLSGQLDMAQLETDALQAQSALAPGIDLDGDKVQRNWTKLDLRAMAKRRDTLAAPKSAMHGHSLEREYLSIYKTACSVVHADCSSLSFHYLDLLPLESGRRVLMARPDWALIVAAALAHYDVIQCFEVLSWLGVDSEKECQSLMQDWAHIRDRYM